MAKVYDVVIVGSGAGGGMFAKVLTEAGADVLLVEAGGHNIDHDIRHHQWPWELPGRNTYRLDEEYTVRLKTKQYTVGQGEREAVTAFDGSAHQDHYNDHFWAKRRDWKYTFPKDKPYRWVRVRALGGKTNCWSANVGRWGPIEFAPANYDGFDVDTVAEIRKEAAGAGGHVLHHVAADHVRRVGAVVRKGREAHRHFRRGHQESGLSNRQLALAAGAAVRRSAPVRGDLQEDGPLLLLRAEGRDQPRLQRTSRLPLLRRVPSRLRFRIEVHHRRSFAAAGLRHRTPDGPHELHRARSDDRCRRPRARRCLCGSLHVSGGRSAGQSGGAGGQRDGVRAHYAEFQIAALLERDRQFQRTSRPQHGGERDRRRQRLLSGFPQP